ncbi:pseudouridine synthase [Entomospira entomophila]|uniref:Pseudouridine synthase RsuA/RluA-like domain-containing protein n=1 Tax=Entomospira entomophila TaxID=2719988 RepID=A0A968GAE1_9SPIO|nr:pseudouridine synthase [Entomospira entomophilus]NIZ40867.1 hypothetical protein [Entomospira entomophilus]WDI35080.1 pseudouridine synthase [Entomospira entomophilus]
MQLKFKLDHQVEPAVLYQDHDIVLLYKPHGMHTVIQSPEESASLESFWRSSELANTNLPDTGLIQRLDYVTAGMILGARTQESYEILSIMGKNLQIQKEYLALCRKAEAYFLPEGYSLDKWMELLSSRQTWSIAVHSRFVYRERGRTAVRLVLESSKSKHASMPYETNIELLQYDENEKQYLVRACIKKGYRHQVRATLHAIGLPIIGDELYGDSHNVQNGSIRFKAVSIIFLHPVTMEEYECVWVNAMNGMV